MSMRMAAISAMALSIAILSIPTGTKATSQDAAWHQTTGSR